MAFASDSTTAPARPLLALVPFAFRPSAPVDDGSIPELPPEPLLSAADVLHGAAGSQPAQSRSVDYPGNSDVVPNYPGMSEVAPNYPDRVGVVADLSAARTLHLRRQLAQAAEHGAALLASLGLPRLVGPDHIVVDPVAAGDALDLAIATLDALDGDTDVEDGGDDEPSLGWEKPGSQFILTEGAYSGDRELDTADGEPSLASPERHPTIPLSFRDHAYTARGGEEGQLRWAEGARDDREMADEDGPIDDDELDGAGEVDAEPSIGWPEDVAAEVVLTFSAEADAEHDDADLEGDLVGDLTWVFGPSRREVAHV